MASRESFPYRFALIFTPDSLNHQQEVFIVEKNINLSAEDCALNSLDVGKFECERQQLISVTETLLMLQNVN